MEGLLGLLAGFMFGIIILIIVFYILACLGLMKITEKVGETGGWMAWFPIFNVFLIGKLGFNKIMGWAFVALSFASAQVSSTVNGETVYSGALLPHPLDSIASFVFAILLIASFHKIYSKMSEKAVIMTVFTVLSFGLLAPIFLFAIRNNEVRA